jgi:4-hydroxymandelate oxidase
MQVGLPQDDLVFDPNISWADIAWIRERAALPLLVKGIMTAEDARIALDHGVDGIVVSNHGGRQLDGVAAGVTVLPEVVEAVGGRVPVLVDGGIRRGTDVLKALALGAAAVLVGRPTCWGLAVAGEQGVAEVLGILRAELENAMALAGVRSVVEITAAFVSPA